MSMVESRSPSSHGVRSGPVVVMGVSGCGKSSVGERLANLIGCPFVEGDAFHSLENVRKMNGGVALDDDDRWPWLDLLGAKLASENNVVVSCSSLKWSYRDRLRTCAAKPMTFIFLEGTRSLLSARLALRTDHYMPPALLDSQLATLEPVTGESDVVTIDVDQPVERIAGVALAAINARQTSMNINFSPERRRQ